VAKALFVVDEDRARWPCARVLVNAAFGIRGNFGYTLAMSSKRIVSLLASASEIVAALGASSQLVGRSHECDFPPEIAAVPVLTRARVDGEMPSGEIDRGVRGLIDNALSIHALDASRLKELAPDIIITQTLCEACAVTPEDVDNALAEWTGSKPRVLALEPRGLGDVASDIFRIAAAIKREQEGLGLLTAIEKRFDAIVARVAELEDHERLTVAALEWIDPLVGAGHWVPELIEMAGGISLTGKSGQASARIELADLAARDPDVIIVAPRGLDLRRARAEMAMLALRPEWRALRAVATRQVFLIDGGALVNRPGPRLAESLESIAEILHRQLFVFGHRGRYWDSFRAD
jgi:iron complex transport system substrate-binding protein